MHDAVSDSLSGSVSARKLEANRANAQKSTGPRTAAGRQRSSQNAARHSMLAKTATLLAQPNQELKTLLARYHADFRPSSVHEETLVEDLAVSAWRMKHINRIETALLSVRMEQTYDHVFTAGKPPAYPFPYADEYGQIHEPEPEEVEPRLADAAEDVRELIAGAAWGSDPAVFALILRYQTQARRDYYRALKELERVRTGQAGYLPEEQPPSQLGRPIEPEPQTAASETKPTAPAPRTAAASASNQTNPPAPVEPVSSPTNGETPVNITATSDRIRQK
ncbi:MAG: hypothetical protein KIT09_23395 [Bryobacteraceae bacterium]|nr:hypothetical protein [Bryobacteraceae bacterium]